MANETLDINPAAFAGWLAAHRDHEVVGTAKTPCNCPLARYLRLTGAGQYFITHGVAKRVCPATGTRWSALPNWARSFTRWLDQHPGIEGDTVTARIAQAVMAQVLDNFEQRPATTTEQTT